MTAIRMLSLVAFTHSILTITISVYAVKLVYIADGFGRVVSFIL